MKHGLHTESLASRPSGDEPVPAEFLRLAFESSATGLCLVSPDGGFLLVNPALCAMLGRDAETLTACTWQELTHPDDLDGDLALVEDVRRGRIPGYRLVKRFLRPDGAVVWGDLSVSCVREADGTVRYFLSQIVDVSARVAAEEALERSEREFRELASGAGDILMRASVDFTILSISDDVEAVAGWSPEELVGKAGSSLWHPDDAAALAGGMRGMQADEATVFRGRLLCKDGAYKWFDIRRLLSQGPDGAPEWVSVSRDVNAQVLAEDALTASEQRVRATLDTLLDPHVVLGAVRNEADAIVDFVFLDANQAACEFNGLPYEELIGLPLLGRHPAAGTTELFGLYVRLVETGEPIILDDWSYPQDLLGGDLRRYDVRAVRLGDGLSQTWRDVTERYDEARRVAESEERFRLLLENATDVVFHQVGGVIEWIAPSVRDLLAWDSSDLVGRPTVDLWHPDDADAATALRDAAYAGTSGEVEARFRRKDGRYVWLNVSVRPYTALDGRRGMVGALRDVTAQREARAALEESEERYRAIADTAVDAIITADPAGKIEGWNTGAERMFGYAPEDAIGAPVTILMPDKYVPGHPALMQRLADGGAPHVLGATVELQGRRRDGAEFPIELSLAQWTVSGERHLTAIIRDITERLRSAEELRESEERFRTLAENASDVVFRGTTEGVLVWLSQSVTMRVGWSPEEMLGRRFIEFLHPGDLPRAHAVQTGLKEGVPGTFEARVRVKAGGYRWMSVSAHPVFDDGGRVAGGVGGWRDIQAEVQAREALRSSEELVRANADAMLDPLALLGTVRDETGAIVDFTYLDVNRACCEYVSMSREQLVGGSLLGLSPGVKETGLFDLYVAAADSSDPVEVDDFLYDSEMLDMTARYDIRANRVGDGISLMWRDVTERYEAATRIAESEEHFRLLAENSSDVIVRVVDGVVAWVSPALLPALGWTQAEWIGRPFADFVAAEDLEHVVACQSTVAEGRSMVCRFRAAAKDGALHWIEIHVKPYFDREGVATGSVGSFRIVDAQVAAEIELDRRARYDALTGLLNREEAFARVTGAAAGRRRTGRETAALFCDVDKFKTVNDTLGHAAGDEVLRELAVRLRHAVRSGDHVARMGGDELLALLIDVRSLEDAAVVAEKVRRAAREPIRVPGGVVTTSMSVGVTLLQHGEDVDSLVARADAAMYEAKKTGRDKVVVIGADAPPAGRANRSQS